MKRDDFGPATVVAVAGGSPAEAAGVLPCDRIIRVDGRPLRDLIDFYMALSDDGTHVLDIVRTEDAVTAILELRGAAAGIEIAEPVFGRLMTCENQCMFCFVDQLPAGLKPSAYVKDDDYRLSFLSGNFITLTNLGRRDLKRIKAERLSPLYVSLHSSEDDVRRTLFGNPGAGRALGVLEELLRSGIDIHVQIVLVRGVNDAEHLDRTLEYLLGLHGGVGSVGVVPVGLTAGGVKTMPASYGFDRASAAEVLEQLERWTSAFGGAGPFAADEFFFMADRQPPAAEYYSGFEQLENGIGIARLFRDSFTEALKEPIPAGSCEGLALVTTPIGAWGLGSLGIEETGARLVVCENTLFGDKVNVCGLLPGRDAATGLAAAEGAKRVLVPAKALGDAIDFIDGMSLEMLTEMAGLPVEAVPCEGEELVGALSRLSRGGPGS